MSDRVNGREAAHRLVELDRVGLLVRPRNVDEPLGLVTIEALDDPPFDPDRAVSEDGGETWETNWIMDFTPLDG